MISCAILAMPLRKEGKVHKGAMILSCPDEVCQQLPKLREYFYIVERRGWKGMNDASTADIKLVEDSSTWDDTERRFPACILLDMAGADFVNTDVFRPLGVPKPYAGIHIACWQAFKRHYLLVRAAGLCPDLSFIAFGHFPEGGDAEELALKRQIMCLTRSVGADVRFPYAHLASNGGLPSRGEEVNALINQAAMGILTTAVEGINRFKTECMAADVPVLVPSDVPHPTRKHVNEHTGVFYEPTAEGLAAAVRSVLNNPGRFSPREYILAHTGRNRSLASLAAALRRLACRDGVSRQFDEVDWDGRNQSLLWGGEALTAVKDAIALAKGHCECGMHGRERGDCGHGQ